MTAIRAITYIMQCVEYRQLACTMLEAGFNGGIVKMECNH